MDLETASRYVNNLLLKGGLLRGSAIPFENPSKEPGSERRILNLVHELVSRRERETEQLETLVMTVRSVRNEDAKKQNAIDKLKLKNEELERQIALLKAQHRATTTSLSSAEHSVKAHREEAARLKTLLQQVRAKAANDIRQRDLQITKLKEKLVESSRRGTGAAKTTSAYMSATFPFTSTESDNDEDKNEALAIAQETSEYLTELSQNLADENDNLLAIVRRTLADLRSLQGVEDDEKLDNPLEAMPTNYDLLAFQLDETIESLREILTQPNFVSIEEVAMRDEEIVKLKAEITQVETEWKKAIALVDHWNKSLKRDVVVAEGEETLNDIQKEGEKETDEAKIEKEEKGGEEESDDDSEVIVELVQEPTAPSVTPARKKKPAPDFVDSPKIPSIAKLKKSIKKRGSLTTAEMEQLVHGEADL